MNAKTTKDRIPELECCPGMESVPVCDTLNFRYRLPFRPLVGEKKVPIPVEVVLHFRFERCSGPIVIGDPIYSTTLFPGERVRLFTNDRHTRWSYDSETNLAYRHETTSEESFYTAGVAQAMSDLTINESGVSVSSHSESWAEGGGGASFSLFGIVDIGGGGGGGSYDSESTQAFMHSLSRHAESASRYVAASVRAKSATSVGEVEQRTHQEGESESHYESSSRTFENPNRCRAITYIFRKLNKIQHVRFLLVAIERRVNDNRTPTGAFQRVADELPKKVTVRPETISAVRKSRLEVERMDRTSAGEQQKTRKAMASPMVLAATLFAAEPTYSAELRRNAIDAVDRDLASTGILDLKTGSPTKSIIEILSWNRTEILPTPGIIVKGCLDECETCEPTLQEKIQLELQNQRLQNEMLKKQIELLEKSREYRCCESEKIPESDK